MKVESTSLRAPGSFLGACAVVTRALSPGPRNRGLELKLRDAVRRFGKLSLADSRVGLALLDGALQTNAARWKVTPLPHLSVPCLELA